MPKNGDAVSAALFALVRLLDLDVKHPYRNTRTHA